MVELPDGMVPPLLVDPRALLIYAKPKTGKTPVVAQLPNCLILDLEKSSDFIHAPKISLVGLKIPDGETQEQLAFRHGRVDAKGNPKYPQYYMVEVIRALRATPGKYRYGVLDTITKLAEWCEWDATENYMKSPIGVKYNRWTDVDQVTSGGAVAANTVMPRDKWKSVLTLPKGAGYYWLRESYAKWIGYLQPLFHTLILLGHVKIAQNAKKDGTEVETKDLDLTGQLKLMTTADICDANGYMYRAGSKNFISFEPADEIQAGCRIPHLEGKQILISEKLEDGTIKTYWHNIFKHLA